MVVVDRLSKYAHFAALAAGFDAPKVATLFVETVVKHHGFPDKLLSDRDSIFMSNFWTELLSLSGTKLQFTTAYHPQTDGQSEVTNRGLEQYLRAFIYDQPKKWSQLLPWAELALNCSYHSSIGMSPFKALYGRDPPNIFSTAATTARVPEVADLIRERNVTLQTLKKRLIHSQGLMTEAANRQRRHVEFNIGDKVLLKLQPYRQHSVGKLIAAKLGRRFYGPFTITERIGAVAYRLQLPATSKVHDVFHVSLLRPFVPPLSESAHQSLPAAFHRSQPIDVAIRAAAERTVLVHGVPQLQWQVYWSSSPTSNPSWEPADTLREHFPDLRLEDKASLMGGGVDRLPAQPAHEPALGPLIHLPSATAQAHTKPSEPKSSSVQHPAASRPKRKISKPNRYKDYSCN